MLPEWYKDWIDRVSNIVSFVFPFDWEWEMRYREWLEKLWINEEEYLSSSQELWTEVHNNIENFINNENVYITNDTADEIEHWINYIKSLSISDIWTEKYIKDVHSRYQWTCDLLYKDKEGNYYLKDWKTYKINQKRFPQIWVADDWKIPPVPKHKKDKVQLQMSLYAKALYESEWILVKWISLLYLHKNWLKEIELEIISFEEINSILRDYLKYKTKKMLGDKNTDIKIEVKSPLKIHLQTSPCQYWAIWVDLDLSQLDSGQTPTEAIQEAIDTQKFLHNSYKDFK